MRLYNTFFSTIKNLLSIYLKKKINSFVQLNRCFWRKQCSSCIFLNNYLLIRLVIAISFIKKPMKSVDFPENHIYVKYSDFCLKMLKCFSHFSSLAVVCSSCAFFICLLQNVFSCAITKWWLWVYDIKILEWILSWAMTELPQSM